MKKIEQIHYWALFFTSILTILFLILNYSDSSRSFGGWFITRNILILLIPISILIFSVMKLFSRKLNKKLSKLIESINLILDKFTNLLLSLLFFLADGSLILFWNGIFFSKDLLKKIFPDFLLILFTLCLFSIIQQIKNRSSIEGKKFSYFPIILLGGLILLLSMNYKLTGLDMVFLARNYFGAGVPINPLQLLIAIFSGLAYFFLIRSFKLKPRLKYFFDVFIIFFVFIFAYLYWNSVETPINFFLRESSTGSLVPYSDSRLYDLNGLGFAFGQKLGFGTPALKPIYSFFLGLLHLIFRQDYKMILTGQTFFISLLPVIFYILGAKIYNRGIGLSGAILIIFHEFNLIILSSKITQSSLKMLMSESFISVFILLFILVSSLWFNKPRSKKLSLISGACLAICIMIRVQMAAFIPIYIFFFMFSQKQKSQTIKNLIIFLIGVALVLFPWLSRNFIQSGQFVIEETGYIDFTLVSTATQMDQLYSSNNDTIGTIYNLIISHPEKFINRISSYLNNSLMSSLYQIPYSFEKLNNVSEISKESILLYPFPYRELSKGQLIGLVINIVILFLGMVYSWYKSRSGGINPLVMYLGYAVITSLIGFSGWRFIQPVDWIILLYWCTGIFGLFELISIKDFIYSKDDQVGLDFLKNPRIGIIAPTFVILLGLLLPVSELFIPSHIQVQNKTEILEQMTSSEVFQKFPEKLDKISNLLIDNSSIGFTGIALYPTYISPNDLGESKLDLGIGNYPSYYPDHQVYGHLRSQDSQFAGKNILFITLANKTIKEVFLFNPKRIMSITDGEEIIGIGCDRGEYIQAYWLRIGSTIIESTNEIPLNCNAK